MLRRPHNRHPGFGLRGLVLLAVLLFAAAGIPARADESAVARLADLLAAQEAKEGAVSPYLLPVIEQLAQARLRVGELDAAAALRRRALGIALAAFGCESASAAEAMAALALVQIDRRRHLDAEPLLIVAQRVLAARVAGDHPSLAAIDAGLARVALARGDGGPALAWAGRAVETARRNPHGRSAEPLRALGAALTVAGRFDEAEAVLNEALAQDRRHHGFEGRETARSLAELANLDLRRGRAKNALPLIQQALAIDQGRLGPSHPFIADDLHDLGLVYETLNRPDPARRAFSAAVALLERGAGRETPRVAYAELELSRLHRAQGNDAAAEAAHRDARRILNKAEAEERRRERRA
jgi:tetratricopeptide (TPR) repeat protein